MNKEHPSLPVKKCKNGIVRSEQCHESFGNLLNLGVKNSILKALHLSYILPIGKS